ncbi:MFS transporter [Streptomyces diacarni]|uniref:MFS transporter n=1 Tax=Streptomyces diacarni TaxID=2800381 RepID=UPI0033F36188
MAAGIGSGRGLLATMAVVVVCSGVVQGYLTPLLPGIGAHLGIGSVGQNNLYLLSQLAFAVLTPLLSRLGDLYGHRRVLRVSVSMVTGGSLLMAAWPATATLALGMVLQGAVVGFFPLLAGILRSRAPELGRTGMSVLVGALLVSIGGGGLVAGSLSEGHAVAGLWTAVPLSAAALTAALVLPEGAAARGGHFHFGAAALLTLGLVALVLVLAQGSTWGWTTPASWGTAALALVLLAAWVAVEHRAAHPLVKVRLLRGSRLAVVNVHTFCLAFGTIGFLGANAVFLGTDPDEAGYGMGWGSRTIALVSLAMVAVGCLGSTATPRLAGRVGDRAMLALGGAVCAAGFLTMTAGGGAAAPYLVGALLVGLANGIFEAVTRTLAAEVVAEDETALSVGLNELALSLGAAIGAAVIGALFAAHRAAPDGPLTLAAFRWSWTVCAGVALLGAAAGLAFRHGTAERGPAPAHPARPAGPSRAEQPLARNGDAA